MGGNPERPEERLAADLFVHLTDAIEARHVDDGRADSHWDYDVVHVSGSWALEVTQHTDQALESYWARAIAVHDSRLSRSWWIEPEDTRASMGAKLPDYRRLAPDISVHLLELERADLDQFQAHTDFRKHPAILKLARLGVSSGIVLPDGESGVLRFGGPNSPAFWVNPNAVNGAVDRAVLANQVKLEAAAAHGYGETHLWIWLRPHDYPVYRSFLEPQLPTMAPDIPVWLTRVWVANLGGARPLTVRSCGRGTGWVEAAAERAASGSDWAE